MNDLTDREAAMLIKPVAIVATLLKHFAQFIPERDPNDVLAFVSECAAEWRASGNT